MKKGRIASFFVSILVILMLLPALAKAESFQVRIITQDANVRLKPEADSPVILTMPLGSVLEAEEGTAEWYKVTLPPDENGFVVIGYIQKSDTEPVSAEAPIQEMIKPPAQPAAAAPQPQLPQVAPGPRRSGGMELGLRLFGGLASLFGTEHLTNYWADYIDFNQDYYDWAWGSGTVDISGDPSPIGMGLSGGMEVFFNINPYVGFGLGGGLISHSKENLIEYYDNDYGDDWDETFLHKLSAPYFQMTFYGGLPLGRMLRIMPYFGVGVYMGKFVHDYVSTYRYEDYEYEYSELWTAKSNTFGFHLGLNAEVYFSRKIGFFLGGGLILANFKDEFVGDLDWEERDNYYSDSGTDRDYQLWFYEEEGWSTSNWYATMQLNDDEPSEQSWRRNVEPGFLRLSQFRFVIGIVINFMR